MNSPVNILFLTLKVFSATGGIEKVSRIAGMALHEICGAEHSKLKIYSLYDEPSDADKKYFPMEVFTGFGVRRMRFVMQSIRDGIKSNVVLLSHINLLPVGYLIKKLCPKTKVILLAHGIEVWGPLSLWKKKMLRKCDSVLAVSNFTRDAMLKNNLVKSGQCIVLNNCLDPFLQELPKHDKPSSLLKRYGVEHANIILMTLTRISFNEKYKGYEKVIKAMQQLLAEFPDLKYIIIGKYDEAEKNRLDEIVKKTGVINEVIFTGFIPDDELAGHYNLADVYVMPSKKEGFGISFIEAMFYGIPVIAGNKDGSADALCNGALGILVDPENQEEITTAIRKMVTNKALYVPDRKLLLEKFAYPVYKNNLKAILKSLQAHTDVKISA